jgi:hypothetical protein
MGVHLAINPFSDATRGPKVSKYFHQFGLTYIMREKIIIPLQ